MASCVASAPVICADATLEWFNRAFVPGRSQWSPT
jgi:hypothetical protein